MELTAVVERVERVIATRADGAAPPAALKVALAGVRDLRSFCAAAEADLARRLAEQVSFAEAELAESSGESLHASAKTLERAATLEAVPGLADALDDAAITAGHVDTITKAAKGLENDDQRSVLFGRVDDLVAVAETATIAEFAKRVRSEASRILADAGVDRLERQVRDTTLSTWVGNDGMWNLRGRYDPVTGMKLAAKLDTTVEALFAEATPASCPTDPVAKQGHLRALALGRLVDGTAGVGRPGRPEFVAVIDVAAGPGTAHQTAGSAGSVGADPDAQSGSGAVGAGPVRVDWPIPIEVPHRVLAELVDDADVRVVVVRNGVVLHAPGELNLGRTTRLANRAQRRALRGLYRTCAIPGCATHYDRCKLHHIIWWRHGGRTDLANLIPVCVRHHHKIHDAGWNITLGPNRELTLTLPDGTIHNTGPPNRLAA
ncbi:MAG: HNH endonuclease [Ilumatobacter sp.]|nr:HNH endonuclease [Ilumatobacter sp.]